MLHSLFCFRKRKDTSLKVSLLHSSLGGRQVTICKLSFLIPCSSPRAMTHIHECICIRVQLHEILPNTSPTKSIRNTKRASRAVPPSSHRNTGRRLVLWPLCDFQTFTAFRSRLSCVPSFFYVSFTE